MPKKSPQTQVQVYLVLEKVLKGESCLQHSAHTSGFLFSFKCWHLRILTNSTACEYTHTHTHTQCSLRNCIWLSKLFSQGKQSKDPGMPSYQMTGWFRQRGLGVLWLSVHWLRTRPFLKDSGNCSRHWTLQQAPYNPAIAWLGAPSGLGIIILYIFIGWLGT